MNKGKDAYTKNYSKINKGHKTLQDNRPPKTLKKTILK